MVDASKPRGPKGLVPAAAYIRMSGRGQEKSPAEQRRNLPSSPPAKGSTSSNGSATKRSPAIAPRPPGPGWRPS